MQISCLKLSEKLRDSISFELASLLNLDYHNIKLDSIDFMLEDSVLNLTELEKLALIKALSLSKGNISKAASLLGITRKTVYALIKKHSIDNYLHTRG